MQTDFEKSLLAEQQRKIISLLQDIKKQGEPLSMAELKHVSPEDFKTAKLLRASMADLSEIVEVEAQRRGFNSVDAMLEKDRNDDVRKEKAKKYGWGDEGRAIGFAG